MKKCVKKIKPLFACLLVISLLSPYLSGLAAFAETIILPPPQSYQVSDIGYVQNITKKDWYADLKWNQVTFPAEATDKYITLGLNEVESGTGHIITDAIKIPLPGAADSHKITEYSPDTLKHGRIYESYARGSYKINNQGGQISVESQKSNPIKFLTGIHASVELIPGTNNIKIKWDDVWDANGRISYRILISDTKGFTQPPPIPDIVASEIGKENSPVIVNTTEKKLEYTYTFALPGREYSIKVVPIPDRSVACASAEEIEAITIKTDILLKAQKVGYTNDGDTIWKLFWNPIVKGSTFTRVEYELYRYTNDDVTGQLYRLIPEQDSYQITIASDDPNIYSFKIDAKAYSLDNPVPVEFRSNTKVALKEQVPQQPAAPELKDAFLNADPEPLIYDELLTSTGATIMWNVPYTGEGFIDTDITYDMYLVEDIRDVASPPTNFRIASDLSMGELNEIKDLLSGKIVGYKYELVGLKSNSTYYFVIYAKKNFLVQSPSDGFMITMPYISKQTVKVIITSPDAGADRPIAPDSPPFKLKAGSENLTYTDAVFLLEKKWHALYDDTEEKWGYATKGEYDDNLLLTPPERQESMIVNYMPGWRVVPHVVAFNDALNAIKLRQNRAGEYITYSDLSQPDILNFQIEQQSVAVPDYPGDQEDQSFEINVSGLTHNTTYIVWLTIENQNGISSDPSVPVIITTPPNIPPVPVIPTVPNDLKGVAAADFVDLFWTFKKDMEYEIECGTEDSIEKASISGSITYEELVKTTFYRLSELNPDTLYYIWIRTVSTAPDGSKIMSEYSNPLIIKTEAYKPPAPPSGFGVKSGSNGVTENSITYEWETIANYKYYLEFADNIDFDNASMNEVNGNTYTVTGLLSNRRYYARLYAFDNKTGLRSVPTQPIMVITNKSKDDYDSSFDLDDVPTGDALVISPTVQNGVWTADSTGINAHRLAEEARNIAGSIVKIDLSQPPAKAQTIRLNLGAVLIDTLSELKKELYVKLPSTNLTIRPDSLQTDEYFKMKNTNTNFTLCVEAVSPATVYKTPADLRPVTPVTELKIGAAASPVSFKNLAKPIKIDLPVENLSAYGANQIKAYHYDEGKKAWSALSSAAIYLSGRVSGELGKPGAFMAAALGVKSTGTVPQNIASGLNSIQSVFKLNAISGKSFNHAAAISQYDSVKLLMDVVPASYDDSNFLDLAVKSKIVKSASDIRDGNLRRDQAIDLLVSFYAYKTRESTVPVNPSAWSSYTDFNKADTKYVNSLKFAAENGIVQGNGSNLIYPDRIATYGEFIVMLERVLRLCGEL